MSDFKLDVDSPYPIPSREMLEQANVLKRFLNSLKNQMAVMKHFSVELKAMKLP
jgi:hypothetical protein